MTNRVAMIGAGLIGTGWAVVFARAGWDVAIYDIKPGRAEQSAGEAAATLRYLEQEGLLESADTCKARLHTASSLQEAVAGATYVQENVLETPEQKLDVFEQLDKLVPPEIICGSSSSTIPVSQFSEHLETRQRCIIVHPMTPPYLVPVVEIVPAPWTPSVTTDYAMALMEDLDMKPIRLNKEIFGFVLNRFQVGLINEAMYLVEEGIASPEDIEKTLTYGLGLRWSFMGMFQTMDLLAPTGFGEYAKKFGHSYTKLGKQLATDSPWADAAIDKVDAY
ncbi:MAG: 3-hydroxyacyl-CoA dehydrogenase NAD-binding domain-containing protein, partial [Gammaproteobacteria bacterium]